jgi:hypothetical protein
MNVVRGQARRQAPTSEAAGNLAPGRRTISGVVVSATTGMPIEGADVTLRESESTTVSLDTTTDAEGRFAFTRLHDGRFALHAAHRGYIAAGLEEHDGYFTGVVTGPGVDSSGIRFPLSPQGVISGTVGEDSGDPVPRASVHLYREDNRTGVQKKVNAGTTNTDDLGHYEFPRLAPGNYFIAVMAKPWYATHRQPVMTANGGMQEQPRSPLDVAYETTYYPDATDADQATSIAVKPGDRIPINFSLHPVPAVQITVQMPRQGEGQMIRPPQVRQDIFGTEQSFQPLVTFTTPPRAGGDTQSLTINGIAPGHYTLESMRAGDDSGRSYSVDATGNTTVAVNSEGTASADVIGQVAMADGSSLPSGLNITLRSQQGNAAGPAYTDATGNFQIHELQPGDYEVDFRATAMAVGAARMSAVGATVSGNVLKIGTTPVTMAAMLTSSNASVRGYAESGGKRVSGKMMVLVPKNAEDREMFRRDQSNSDGSFEFKRTLPGEYTVVGIDDGWDLEWARPEVIAHYLAGGTKVTMPAKSRDVDMKDPVEVQMK